MTRHASDIGAFEIDSLPGQCQVAICHSFMVREGQRGQGSGHRLKADQEAILRHYHYDYAICTVASTNEAQKRVLERQGWRPLDTFSNHRSCETTELWGRRIAHEDNHV